MSIRFACGCGQQLAVKDEYAGRKVRCTACSTILVVPGGAGAVAQAPRATAAPAAPKKASSRPDEDEDERPLRSRERDDRDDRDEDEEERPRRRRKKSNPTMKIVIIAGSVLLLLGAGFLVYKLFFSSKTGASLADFDLVPRNAAGFVTVRPAEMLKSNGGKQLLDMVKQADTQGAMRELETKAGVSTNDITRVTVVYMDAQFRDMWVIVKSSKTFDQKKITDTLKGGKEMTHEGKKYYYSKGDDMAIHFVDSNQVVIAPEKGMKTCLALPAKPGSGPLDDYVAMASRDESQVLGAGSVTPDQTNMMRQQAGGMLPVSSLLEMKSSYFTLDLKDKLDISVGMEMPSKDKAASAVKELDQLITTGKTFMMMAPPDIKGTLSSAFDQLKPKQDGTKVSVKLSLDSGPILTAISSQMRQQGGGNVKPPPRRPPGRP